MVGFHDATFLCLIFRCLWYKHFLVSYNIHPVRQGCCGFLCRDILLHHLSHHIINIHLLIAASQYLDSLDGGGVLLIILNAG